jgi:uncharacterized protein (TIGR00725 family)
MTGQNQQENRAEERSLPSQSAQRVQPMKLKIGVMGGAATNIEPQYLEKAKALGRAAAEADCVVITGACPGLPLAAAQGAHERGGAVIGISPALSLDEHAFHYESPTLAHDVLIFTGSGLMGREVVNIRSSDIVVIIGGSSGTLGELAIAYDEGKLIGVLTGSGGISDMVHKILDTCNKQTGARVIYDHDPQKLIEQVLHLYHSEHYRHPSVFCRRTEEEDAEWVAGSQQDPVCGMWVPPREATARRTRNGHPYVFCSLQCAERFDLDPDKYLNQ